MTCMTFGFIILYLLIENFGLFCSESSWTLNWHCQGVIDMLSMLPVIASPLMVVYYGTTRYTFMKFLR